MNAFKSYASRALNRQQLGDHVRRWSRHGSTVYLWTPDAVRKAVRYVIDKQGEAMALDVRENPRYVSDSALSPPLYVRRTE